MSTTTTTPDMALHAVTATERDSAPADRDGSLTSADVAAAGTNLVTAGVMLLGLIGLANSFANVTEALEPTFGALAWTATIGIDLGILVFSAAGLVLAMLDLHIPWLRLVPWSLTAATIYLNVAGETTWVGRIAHAVLPGLWVVAVEVGTHVLRTRAGIASGKRMESIRWTRWLLAPWRTLLLWRRMVLWEIRSYPDALARERARVLAKTELQQRYGRGWRRKAPKRTVALYRLGELVPAEAIQAPAATVPALPAARPAAQRKRSGTKPRSATAKVAPVEVADLLPIGREIAARLATEDRSLTRDALRTELRNAGHGLSNAKAGQLLALVRQDEARDESLKEAS